MTKTQIPLSLILIILVPFLLMSCTASVKPEVADNEAQTLEYIKITAAEAKVMMDSEEVIVLDVRTPEESKVSRIAGSLLIPDYEIDRLAAEKLPDKDATILVYCASGRRSEKASRQLIELGYTNVYDFGGINGWPFETVSGD
ncbi:MAG TPA: rhodanese-like domain-containing protein [Candidatus Limnocylindrales bacterium]|nr:rhodanese-like domain-containing protein [Candidatus Limnocylindrales bacterium]